MVSSTGVAVLVVLCALALASWLGRRGTERYAPRRDLRQMRNAFLVREENFWTVVKSMTHAILNGNKKVYLNLSEKVLGLVLGKMGIPMGLAKSTGIASSNYKAVTGDDSDWFQVYNTKCKPGQACPEMCDWFNEHRARLGLPLVPCSRDACNGIMNKYVSSNWAFDNTNFTECRGHDYRSFRQLGMGPGGRKMWSVTKPGGRGDICFGVPECLGKVAV